MLGRYAQDTIAGRREERLNGLILAEGDPVELVFDMTCGIGDERDINVTRKILIITYDWQVVALHGCYHLTSSSVSIFATQGCS